MDQEHEILGVCPTCYLVVKKGTPNVTITSYDEQIAYHRECEPTRMKFMRENKKKWENEGERCKKLRESYHHSLSELAEYLNVSVTKLRRFESGKPVTHARLLSMSYLMYFELFSIRVESAKK